MTDATVQLTLRSLTSTGSLRRLQVKAARTAQRYSRWERTTESRSSDSSKQLVKVGGGASLLDDAAIA